MLQSRRVPMVKYEYNSNILGKSYSPITYRRPMLIFCFDGYDVNGDGWRWWPLGIVNELLYFIHQKCSLIGPSGGWSHAKRLSRCLPKLAGLTTFRISTPVQNCISISLGDFAPPPHMRSCLPKFTQLIFWVLPSSNSLPPRPLRRFWRSIHQKTSLRTSMCLLGVPRRIFYILTPFSPKKRKFLVDFRRDKILTQRSLTWGLRQ